MKTYYSNNCDVYHLTNTDTGEYDAKLSVYHDHAEYYEGSDSNWIEHTHEHCDNDGNWSGVHGMEPRNWETKQRD